jgi:hypothetical protein
LPLRSGAIDRRIRHAEKLQVRGYLYDEEVTDPPARHAESAVFIKQGMHQSIGVDVTFHHHLGFAGARNRDRLCSHGSIGRRRYDPILGHIPAHALTNSLRLADEKWLDKSKRVRFAQGLEQHGLRRVGHGDADRLERSGLIHEMLQVGRECGHGLRLSRCK